MSFIVYGLNHHTAPVAIRERVVFTPENTPATLHALLQSGAANEAMILSTCNRTEIYGKTTDPHQLTQWLNHHLPLTDSCQPSTVPPQNYWYQREDQQAVSHIMRVASGLDSQILGEPQILGQLKKAFLLAQQAGSIGSQLQRLLQRVFAVTKQVRSLTGVGASPVSVAYAAVGLAKRIFTDIRKCRVLLIGAGQTMELAALHLSDCGVKRLVIANRQITRAQRLAQPFHGHAIALEDIPVYLQQTDVVLAAVGSALPIIGKGMVEYALKSGKRRPLLMVDLSMPRSIEPQVNDLEDVYLYNLDHLTEIVEENRHLRQASAAQAEAMIDTQARYFMRQLQALDAVSMIRDYRTKLEVIRQEEMTRARAALANGQEPAAVLANVTRTLTNKIMHNPTLQLHQAAFDGQWELLLAAKKLLDIQER